MTKTLLILLLPICVTAQPPNCNIYLYNKDTAQYNACKSVEDVRYYQYTSKYQQCFDRAIDICPHFAYAYRAKSTAYLKSGDFITWKQLIDKAVQYDTLGNIGYRGWCRMQFFRDYTGAIEDITYMEKRVGPLNAGYTAGGEYHLLIGKALCFSMLGKKKEAIRIMEKLLAIPGYTVGQYDYYQLGVTCFQVGETGKASAYFNKQSAKDEFAENRFYKALVAKKNEQQKRFEAEKKEAIRLYNEKKMLFDPYTEPFNKVYLSAMINEQFH